MMTATRPEVDTHLIEHLDFEPACTNRWCDDGHPVATAVVEEMPCKWCGQREDDPVDLICRPCYDEYTEQGACCSECDELLDPGEVFWFIRWLR